MSLVLESGDRKGGIVSMGGLAKRREKAFALSNHEVFGFLPTLSSAFWVIFWQELHFFPGLSCHLCEQQSFSPFGTIVSPSPVHATCLMAEPDV